MGSFWKFKSGLIKDFAYTFGTNVMIFGGALLGGVISARLLGPQGRGELAATVAWVGLLVAVAELGIPQAIIYNVAKGPEVAGTIVGTSISMALLFGGLPTLAGYFLLLPILKDRGVIFEATQCYLLCVPLILAMNYISAAFQGLGRFKYFNVIRLSHTLSYVGALALMAFLSKGEAKFVIWCMIVILIVFTLIAFALLNSLVPMATWRINTGTGRTLLGYGLKAYAGNLALTANGKLDQVLISIYLPAAALGVYAVSASYGVALTGLSTAFAVVTFQRVAGASNREAAFKTLRKLLFWNFILTAGFGLIMIAGARYAIPLVFGKSFVGGVQSAHLLVISSAFLGFNCVLSSGLRGLGHPVAPSKAETLGLIVNLVAIPILTHRFGIVGAACGTVCGSLTTFAVLQSAIRNVRIHPPVQVQGEDLSSNAKMKSVENS